MINKNPNRFVFPKAVAWRCCFRTFCLTIFVATRWYFASVIFLADVSLTRAQEPHEYPIFGLQFSPDGKFLAAASSSNDPPGPIVIWKVEGWTVHRVHRPTKGSLDVDFSPDGTQLAYGTKAGIVGVLDVTSGKAVREINAHRSAVFSVAFAPDGKSLVSAGADRAIKLWNVSTGELIRRFDGHTDTVDSVAVSPDGTTLLSGGNDQQARLWDMQSGEIKKAFKAGNNIVRRVAFSRDGKYFLVSTWDGYVRIRETSTGRIRAALSSGSNCADMTADNRLVVTSEHFSAAKVFVVALRDATTDEQLTITKLIEQFQYDSYEKRDSATKELVRIGMIAEPQLREAMNHKDAEVRVRARRIREKVLSPEPIAKLSGHRGDVEVVCFAPDGRLIASASRGGDIKIWNTSPFREVLTLDANH